MIKSIKITKSQFYVFAVFLLLYINESLYFNETKSGTLRFSLSVGVLIFLYLVVRNIRIDWNNIVIFAILESLIFCSVLINGFDPVFDLYMMLAVGLAFCVSAVIPFEEFINSYTKVIFFLCICSLIVYVGCLFLPSLFSLFPNYIWHGGITIKNCVLGLADMSSQNKRNWGIFNEPGMHAFFLNLAMLLEMYYGKKRLKYIVVYMLTAATALSTTGVISGIILIFAYVLRLMNYGEKEKMFFGTKIQAFFIMFVFLIAAVLIYQDKAVFSFLFDKLKQIGGSVSEVGGGSGYERWRALIFSLKLFSEHFFFGAGEVGFQRTFYGMIATFTPVNWFALYGIFYGIINIGFYLQYSCRFINRKWKECVLVAVGMIVMISSQNLNGDPFVMILVFYAIRFLKDIRVHLRFRQLEQNI